jgi:hypothetical protein
MERTFPTVALNAGMGPSGENLKRINGIAILVILRQWKSIIISNSIKMDLIVEN